MARFQQFSSLYEAFHTFLQNCVLEDRSLLWPRQSLWVPENVAALKKAIIDSPVMGRELSFEEKLQEQMKAEPPERWGLLADVSYVYYLPSSSMKFETKRKLIAFAAQQGGFSIPPDTDDIWIPLQKGFSHTGQRYNLKYAQFWAILLFANSVKASANRQEIMDQPKKFQDLMDSVLEAIPNKVDRGIDMRHAMLYLAFPDQYEPIISHQDKQAILKVYSNRVSSPLPKDLDQAIVKIRQALAPEKDKEGQPFNFYRPDIKAEWKDTPMPQPPKPSPLPGPGPIPGVQQAMKVLDYTRNLILYGPPGTGKTFIARKIAEELIARQGQKGQPDELLLQKVTETHTLFDVVALGLYLAGPNKSQSVGEIMQFPIIKSRFKVRPVNNPKEVIWSTLQIHSDPESKTVKVTNKAGQALFDKEPDSKWKLIPSGKEYVEQSLADALNELRVKAGGDIQPKDFISSVTFHQSYSYEDFIEGIRPKPDSEEAGPSAYEVMPGIFRRICTRAIANPDNHFVLLIDEINRGNIAKIFGELITLIEDDKRGGEKNELTATLPYSGGTFVVPNNLYVIGTMNTADRSIALLDVALRRRFAFFEMMPDPELLGDESVVSDEGISVHLGNLLKSLNNKICESLDRNHQIGHSYFWKISQAPKEQRLSLLEYSWNYQVLPLIEEYFYSQRSRLLDILAPFIGDLEEGTDPESIEIPRATGEDLVIALKRLSDLV